MSLSPVTGTAGFLGSSTLETEGLDTLAAGSDLIIREDTGDPLTGMGSGGGRSDIYSLPIIREDMAAGLGSGGGSDRSLPIIREDMGAGLGSGGRSDRSLPVNLKIFC
eukprot:Hpha_TRINITY_DN16089_c4_g1::TRINITY_DN16089_c4_g1_i1::g.119465::m.119465